MDMILSVKVNTESPTSKRYIHCMDADTAEVLTVLLTNLDRAVSFTNLLKIAIILIVMHGG